MMKKLIYIILLASVVYSCKSNELPEPEIIDEVVFYAEGNVSGNEFFLEAGPDNVVVESDAELVEGEFPVFTASFENVDCVECSEFLSISLVGESLFDSDAELSALVPSGNFNVTSFADQNIELGFFDVHVDEVDIVNLEIIYQDGFGVFDGEGEHFFNPGDYIFNLISSGENNDCFVEVQGGFGISESGNICMNQVYLDEDDQGVYLDISDFDEQAIITVNDFSISLLQNPLGVIYLESILENDEALQSITVFNIGPGEMCGAEILNYNFSGVNITPDCFPLIDIEQVFTPTIIEPLSVFIEYQSADGIYFTSLADQDSDSFVLTDIEPFGEDLFGRETYRARIEFSVSLISDQDISEVVILNISEAFIPLVFE